VKGHSERPTALEREAGHSHSRQHQQKKVSTYVDNDETDADAKIPA